MKMCYCQRYLNEKGCVFIASHLSVLMRFVLGGVGVSIFSIQSLFCMLLVSLGASEFRWEM